MSLIIDAQWTEATNSDAAQGEPAEGRASTGPGEGWHPVAGGGQADGGERDHKFATADEILNLSPWLAPIELESIRMDHNLSSFAVLCPISPSHSSPI